MQSVDDENGVGLRYDQGKARYDLLPADGIHELVLVYTKGAQKYADRNWELGMPWSKVIAPLLRHTFAWMRGERVDPETGLHHMAHVAWNALALVCYERRGIGTDDRVITPLDRPKKDDTDLTEGRSERPRRQFDIASK